MQAPDARKEETMAVRRGKHTVGKGGGPVSGGNRFRGIQRTGTGLLEGLLMGAAGRVVSNVVGTVTGEVSEVIAQRSDLYQQEQAQKAQLARQEEVHRAQLARQEREREARLKYYSVCPYCDGVNQGGEILPILRFVSGL